MHLWRRTDRDRIEFRLTVQHRLDARIVCHPIDASVTARDGGEGEIGISGDGWNVLIARDLSNADQADTNRISQASSFSPLLRRLT